MATYNGSKWLRQQLDSLLKQDYTEWKLLISDDGSVDDTPSILQEYVALDNRITLLPRRSGSAGHAGNFEFLLNCTTNMNKDDFDIIFLADQDDLWHPSKLSTQLTLQKNALASFTNLEIINAQGKTTGNYMESMNYSPPVKTADLLAQNMVVGCTMALNKSILRIALPFPPKLQNHDWWLALCALATGELIYIDHKLTRYRQHDSNTIGTGNFLQRILNIHNIIRRQNKVIESKIIAVSELSERLHKANRKVPVELERFILVFSNNGSWARCKSILNHEFRARSKLLVCAQLMATLSCKTK